jgi:hypothetical protein
MFEVFRHLSKLSSRAEMRHVAPCASLWGRGEGPSKALSAPLLATYSYIAGCTSTYTTLRGGGAKALAKRPYRLRFRAGSWVTLLSSSSERAAPWQPEPSASCKHRARCASKTHG